VVALMIERTSAWMWRMNVSSEREQITLLDDWFADGRLRRVPNKGQMYAQGPEAFLNGLLPSEPLITEDTRVIAFGSCFAARFTEWLAEHGFNRAFDPNTDQSILRNQLESPAAVAQQFRWAFGELDPDLAFWIGTDNKRFEATQERRAHIRGMLQATDVLIVTLGLCEVWFDTVSGEPIWRVPPRESRRTNRYVPRLSTAAESLEALETIHRLRCKYMPDTKVIYTISPQRYIATFRKTSPIVAHVASKAVLRVAVDEFLRAHPEDVNQTYFYFPGYEIATELLMDPLEEDNRHMRDHHAAFVLDLFARHYTTVPTLSEKVAAPSSALDELQATLAKLEAKTMTLQAVCDERLELIEQLHATCQERLEVIQSLDIELRRIKDSIENREVHAAV
jgi:GSCFA family